ncbi:hypothetical protein ACHAXM_007673 [Skeletonema potamos]
MISNYSNSYTCNQSFSKQLSASLKGVIFDMDGTLIQLNVMREIIQQIYQIADNDPLGKDLGRDDLEVIISKLSPEGKRQAKKAIDEILQRHVDNMIIQEGGPELIAFLAQNGVKRAILTRNYEKNAFLMQHNYTRERNDATFDLIVGKDTYFDESYQPVQEIPKAQRIHQICAIWRCHPSEVIMVGDSITDDIVEGNRAGCGGTVLLQPKGYQLNDYYGTTVGNSLERKPTLCVESLTDLMQYFFMLFTEND